MLFIAVTSHQPTPVQNHNEFENINLFPKNSRTTEYGSREAKRMAESIQLMGRVNKFSKCNRSSSCAKKTAPMSIIVMVLVCEAVATDRSCATASPVSWNQILIHA